MIVPTTYLGALLLTVLALVCWGSWANTVKLGGKWRFELFYYDFAFGVLVSAAIAALTLGSLGSDISFLDNLSIVYNRQIAYAAAAGIMFNLGNMLLVAGISVSGMAVAFPISFGLSFVIGVLGPSILNRRAIPMLLLAAAGLAAASVLGNAWAYHRHMRASVPEAAPQPKRGGARPKTAWKGIVLSVISGLFLGSFYPLTELARIGGDIEMGPYPIALVLAAGVFVSTLIFNLYFIHLPVEGAPISITAYFGGTLRQHALGILGGFLWCAGAIASLVAAATPAGAQVSPGMRLAMTQGAGLIGALWGLMWWREYQGASGLVRMLVVVVLLLFLGGLGLLSLR